MDLNPVNPSADDLTIHEPLCAVFRRHLKELNQKYTPERAQILDTLILHDDTFEAEQLQDALRNKGYSISKATVYRTIKLLQEAGIIQRVALDADQAHYQLVYTTHQENVLVRVDTSETLKVDIPDIDEIIRAYCEREGLVLSGHRLQIYAVKK
ncbi:MAG: transcriptional repressor [Phycisphaerales bacterium]